jgi:hypothetical protein
VVLRSLAAGLMLLMMSSCGGNTPAAPEAGEGEITDIEIVATDFAFQLSSASIAAGEVRTTLINEGSEPHQAGYWLLDEGISFDDFMQQVLKDDSAIPQLSSGGRLGHMRPLSGGVRGVRPGDELAAGTYAVMCSIRDPESGKNHYELGMAAELEVR